MPVTQIVTNESTGGIPTVGVKELYTTGNTYFVDSNNGPGCSANAITTDESSKSCVNNYVNDAAGGALVDVVA